MKRNTTASNFKNLQRGLTGSRSLIGLSYMDNKDLLEAYESYYFPISFEQARYALKKIFAMSGKKITRLIDIGSGPGPIAAACADYGVKEIYLIDQSERALSLAKEKIRAPIYTHAADISKGIPAEVLSWGKFDCLSFGHSLNELYANDEQRIKKRAALLETWSSLLTSGGGILLIEPALLTTSRDLISVRNELISRGWTVLSPCIGRECLPCPVIDAGESHTCHEEIIWKMPPSVAHLAASLKLDKEAVKMTWFFLVPPSHEKIQSRVQSQSVFRVVSDTMKNKSGRLRRLLCGTLGRFPLSVEADSDVEKKSGFSDLQRGDFVTILNPQERESGWGVTENTKIIKQTM